VKQREAGKVFVEAELGVYNRCTEREVFVMVVCVSAAYTCHHKPSSCGGTQLVEALHYKSEGRGFDS
jgi:hypothetical protein